MRQPVLGMYVHTHWGYNHPYAARTWQLADWENYLQGLTALGYNLVMVWPQFDCMAPEPNASDCAYLETISQMIDLAHTRFGMRVAISACPNTIGNEKATSYTFRERPYFVCEKKINPKDRAEVDAFLRGRRNQFELLRNADAVAIIDSDPGGYIGSTNDEFVELVKEQVNIFRSFNPSAEFIYWMLAGWESYNRFWAKVKAGEAGEANMWKDWEGTGFVETLTLMQQQIPEPWSVFAWLKPHKEAVESLGLRDKAIYYPYAVVEGEPTFPLTNCDANGVADALVPDNLRDYSRGIMANAQTHCLQLPHTYMFAHLARGGTRETLDLAGFAGDVLPGLAEVTAQGWLTIGKREAGTQRSGAQALRNAAGREHQKGKLSSLLFGDVHRFLIDLAMNLELRASLTDLKAAIDNEREAPRALRAVLNCLCPYQERLGFVDAYGGPLRNELNNEIARLNDTKLNRILKLFSDWRNPSVRNGIIPRLFKSIDDYCREQGA